MDPVYPVIFIDALMVKIRDGLVGNRPVYLAVGIDTDGIKQVLGMWVGPTTGESAKFWLTVLAELRNRGIGDVCIVCCDTPDRAPRRGHRGLAPGHGAAVRGPPDPGVPALRVEEGLDPPHAVPASDLHRRR